MSDKVYVLRTVSGNMQSYDGFVWPESGPVEALDWEATYKCGHGLHGLLWGEGDGRYLDWIDSAKWLVVEVDRCDILAGKGNLMDKCKFQRGLVVFCGERDAAVADIVSRGADPFRCVACNAITVGYGSNASTAGDRSNASTAGYGSNASTAGYGANASTTGDGANASTTGDGSNASTTGYGSNASTTGYGSNASTTGYGSNASTAGYGGVSVCLGVNGKVRAGKTGVLLATYWDTIANRPRVTVGYPGENGIKADTWYELTDGEFKQTTVEGNES
jgi:hypothetical protein